MPDEAPCSCGCANTFSTREADADLRRYRKDGASRSTRALIDAIVAEGVEGATLLDIGGGIGAIQLELLAAGAVSAESVDATEAYVAAARAEAERRGFGDRTRGRVGDFVALASEIEPADVVTLDKVVCCYSDMPALLTRVAGHARRTIGLVFPRETWWNRLAARLFDAWGWVTRNRQPWYLHSTREIDALLRSAGFVRRDVHRELVWQVALFVRH
jgi:magnesium-protoporphyrin O-methyltransferase